MANSISKFQEIILKTSMSFDDLDTKKLETVAKTASDLMSKGLVKEAGVAFDEIGNMFNKQLIKMGKSEIDFADMIKMPDDTTLEKMTSGFTAAIASNITDGIVSGIKDGIDDAGKTISDALRRQLGDLETQRKKLEKERAQIELSIKNRAKMKDLSTFSTYTTTPLKIDGDLIESAYKLLDEFQSLARKIDKTKRPDNYASDVIAAQEKLNDLYRIQLTLKQNIINLSRDVKEDFGLIRDDNGTWSKSFEEIKAVGAVQEAFEELEDVFGEAEDSLRTIDKELQKIDVKINNIRKEIDGGASNVVQNGLKEVEEIEKAYDRILKKKNKQDDISKAVNYVPGSESLTALKNRYNKSVANEEDWEEQYKWLIKFVKEYETYEARANSETGDKRKNMLKTLKGYTKLYNQIKPLAASAEISLQNVLNMVDEVPLVGIGGEDKSIPVTVSPKVEDPINTTKEVTGGKEEIVVPVKPIVEGGSTGSILNNPMFANMFKKPLKDDGVKHTNNTLDAQSDILTNISKLTDYVDAKYLSAGKHLSNFLDDLQRDGGSLSEELKEILTTLKLIDNQGNLTFDIKRNGEAGGGTTHNGALISDEFVLIERGDYNRVKDSRLPEGTQNARKKGVNVAEVLGYLPSKHTNAFFDVQRKATGHNLFKDGMIDPEVVNATEEQLQQLVQAFITARNNGFDIENGGSNIVYDKDKGFSFYDLEEWDKKSKEQWDGLPEAEKLSRALEDALSIFNGLNRDNTAFDGDPNKDKFIANFRLAVEHDLKFNAVDYKEIFDSVFDSSIREDLTGDDANDVMRKMLGIINGDHGEYDDETETIKKETGALEDKLEVLTEIAEQYGRDISQKKRDSYERLNQKDMDSGLKPSEEERFWELGEEIEDADQALVDFGETYDRIILKLANGKKVEILPDDAGLRKLMKFYDEGYGEDYGGVEVEDVQFERSKADAAEEARILAEQAEAERKATEEKLKQAQLDAEAKAKADEEARLAQEAFEKEKQLTAEKERQARLDAEAKAKAEEELQIANKTTEAERALRAEAEKQLQIANAALEGQKNKSAQAETPQGVAINEEQLRGVLSAITYNVKVVANNDNTTDSKVSIDEQSLRTVLDSITYKTQTVSGVVDDDANKVSIDVEGLRQALHDGTPYDIKDVGEEKKIVNIDEGALNNVITNISKAMQEAPEKQAGSVNVPWALEETLKGQTNAKLDAIKDVLDGINAKEAIQPVSDVGNVLATENTLVAIKTAVESINSKTVQGTKISQEPKPKSPTSIVSYEFQGLDSKTEERAKTALTSLLKYKATLQEAGQLTGDLEVGINNLYDELSQISSSGDLATWNEHFKQFKNASDILKTLAKDYEALGRVSAQAMNEADPTKQAQYLEEVQRLKDRIDTKSVDVNVGDGRFDAIYQTAYENTEREIKQKAELAEAIRLANEARKEEEKAVKDAVKAQEKLDKESQQEEARRHRRDAMTGKAKTAVGRAENVFLDALLMDDYKKLPESFKNELIEYQKIFRALGDEQDKVAHSEVFDEKQQSELAKHTVKVNKLTSKYSELLAEYQKLSGDNVSDLLGVAPGTNASISQYEQALRQAVMTQTNGKAQIKGFNNDTKTLTYTLKTGKNEFTTYTAAVRHLDHQMVSVAGNTKRAETFFEASQRKLKEISSYVSAMSVFNRVGQELRRGLQYVKEIDLALVELRKVTNETEETYDEFLRTAAKTGAKLGSTISAVTEATATFAKLGYEMQQAAQMAEAAIVYKNVGDNIASAEDAADSIISTMKGFGIEASEAMRIVDRFNEVGRYNCPTI